MLKVAMLKAALDWGKQAHVNRKNDLDHHWQTLKALFPDTPQEKSDKKKLIEGIALLIRELQNIQMMKIKQEEDFKEEIIALKKLSRNSGN